MLTAGPLLFGRADEIALLERMAEAAAAGRGGALVIRGEPGIGKTALLGALEHAAARYGLRALRAAGTESESRLPYAAIHQLIHPIVARIGELPAAHRDALRTAVGLAEGDPDVYAVGRALLGLITEVAADQPVVLLLDDLHWLDRASLDVLGFVARRVSSEPVLAVGATRTVARDDPQRRSGLPDTELGRLGGADAAALLDSRAPRLPPPLRQRLLAEAAGNPLALVELPKTLATNPSAHATNPSAHATNPSAHATNPSAHATNPSAHDTNPNALATDPSAHAANPGTPAANPNAHAASPSVLDPGPRTVATDPRPVIEGPGTPADGALPLNHRLEAAFAARAAGLGRRATALLLVLAADTTADPRRLLAAASETCGEETGLRDAQEAIDAGLIEMTGSAMRFRHPLMRSAVYQRAPVADRLDAHRALAAQLTAAPDRRLWHLAAATIGTDEALAANLADYAERARARGATMSAVAALRRAGELTDDPRTAGSLLLRAAELASEAGARHEVEQLLAGGDLTGLGPVERARLTNVLEVVRYTGFRDPLQRVRELTGIAVAAHEAGRPELSMQLLWRAASRSFFQATGPETAAARARVAALVDVAAPHPDDPQALAILAYTVPEERGAEVLDRLRRASETGPDAMRFLGSAALVLGDFARSCEWTDVAVAEARAQGRLGVLARLLGGSNWGRLWLGQWDLAHAELTEAHALAQETGEAFYAVAAQTSIATITAMRGGLDRADALLDEVAASPLAAGMRYIQVALAQARGLMHLFRGDAQAAYATLARTFDPAHPSYHRYMRWWLVPDLLDAALAAGRLDDARALTDGLPVLADRIGAPILLVAARYAEVLAGTTTDLGGELDGWPVHRARLQLHLGRGLRRRHRTQQARDLLRAARDTFDALGAGPWSDAARAELRATGEQSRGRVSSARERLSPQELQIAALAAAGLTNREIAERLFLSHRTVGSHLYRIYPKLGITRRAQLAAALENP
ncbi:DNA-binding CsgD family transcriptional regulator [Catenuloplanes nepalensis]|uniref:DNA-binding CsgD family transcriptional regulator n=1 Tax=Catenuloplanes nepalensis TaxID=587533 RepID=A0ABT9MQE8_9ACTN|nr:LuxR family transcriptional regulator [Catenuloplanes nepalensis]MDP9793624.1 DNA-binding CsgD family transcriptional regulator [Catenuloplanes nepalensis]